jgi:hypothetical protein
VFTSTGASRSLACRKDNATCFCLKPLRLQVEEASTNPHPPEVPVFLLPNWNEVPTREIKNQL